MPGARAIAADLLGRLERRGGRVREALAAVREELGDARERGLLTELAYGCVRRRGTLDAVLASASSRPIRKLNPALRTALRVALYQVLFLDRIPDHAAVDEAVGWVRGRVGARRAGFVNGVLRALLRDRQGAVHGAEDPRRDVPREDGALVRFGRPLFPDPGSDLAGNLAGRFSMPRWLVERWLGMWTPERVVSVLRGSITRPPLTVRARVPRNQLAAALKARDIAFRAGPTEASLLLAPGESAIMANVRSGQAAIQDATSQRVAPLLLPASGQRVLDLCAAPGGKSLHLADLMGTGVLVASDVDAERARGLEDLREAMGAVEYEVVHVPVKGKFPFDKQSFDGILIDAPCSNTGVLRRRVEARWRLKPADIDTLAALQSGLLERALPLLRPGGTLVYSTCSLEPEENEAVLESFLSKHADCDGEAAFRAWPGREADGGFAAVIRLRD